MFLKNHFAGNARGNLLLALKVIIAKTKFLSFRLTKYEAHNKPFTIHISDKRSSGGDIYQ